MSAVLNKVLMGETEIEWDRYILDEDDIARFVDPRTLVSKISDVLHQRGARAGVALPWAGMQDRVRIRRGELSVWAGINFHGKTTMLKQIVLHMVRSGEKVCMASLEELPEVTMAGIARMAVPDTDIRENSDEPDGWLSYVCGELSGRFWLYNQTKMIDPQRVLALIGYCAQELGCTMFVLDSLMRTALPQDDYEGQRVFCNSLDNYARALNIHIALVHHIVKVDESEVPGRHSIRGSGAIIDNCSQSFIVWRNTNEDKREEDPDGLLVVAKNRGLPPLDWIGKVQMFQHKSGQFLRARRDNPMQFIKGM